MTAQTAGLIQNRWGFILFMAAMCSLSPFAMSFIVPSFPGMAVEFDKSVAEIQLLISVFLIGLGLAQPIHGILADRFGRRPVLLTGFAIFVVASIAGAMTTSWTALVLSRLFQAIGVSAGTVTSRAIVNDIQPRQEAAITLSYISIAMGIGPIIAPVIGGILDVHLGWRSIFVGCILAGLIIWFMAQARLPETRLPGQRKRKSLSIIGRDYRTLLFSPKFLGYTMMFGFGQGVFFGFLPLAPDYFENVQGVGKSIFIIAWIALSLAFMTGSLMATRLVKRHDMDTVIMGASLWLIAAGGLMALSYLWLGGTVGSVTITIMLAMLATGMICPLALTGSISFNPELAGTASGLSSSLGLIIGGLFAVISGIIYDGTLWPFIVLAIVASLCNLFAAWLTRQGRTM